MIYRGISFSLQSQYDARAIPEYPPPSATPTPSPHKGITSHTPTSPRLAECYVPVYPGSQLWIDYDCPASEDTSTPNLKYFYFKLFMGGRCLLSWGVGPEDNWHGQTTFAIFRGEPGFEGHGMLEKRAFFFPSEAEVEKQPGSFEIKAFRSKGRRREVAKYQNFEGLPTGAFEWHNAGRMRKTEPRRMFTYALMDAVDAPYATFRYHFRTVAQLEHMGFDLEGTGELKTILTVSPGRAQRSSCDLGSSPPAPAVPKDDLSDARRLSFPPRLHLAPTFSRQEPHSPVKKHSEQAQMDCLPGFDAVRESKKTEIPSQQTQAKSASEDSPPQRVLSFSKKPLPLPPDKQEQAHVPAPQVTSVASGRTRSFRGFARRLKRRSNSRDDNGIFGAC